MDERGESDAERAVAFAVVGAGPAGCYTAQALKRAIPDADITVFDRLLTPYGLVRSGVAADHQGTKAVSRQFARLFENGDLRFAGNVDVGRDIDVATLRRHFDAVVIATGMPVDVDLDLEGADLPGVVGSGRVTRLLNGHPLEARPAPSLGSSVAVIGHGNVAMDVIRLLAKQSTGDLDATDIDDEAHFRLASDVRVVHAIGRSSPRFAKFDTSMFKEIADLDGVEHVVHRSEPASAGAEGNPTEILVQEVAQRPRQSLARLRIEWWFGFTPCSILGSADVEGVRCESADGTVEVVPATSVVTAIGFRAEPDDPFSSLGPPQQESGRVSRGFYVAGWRRRGPRGTIPSQRTDARALAEVIVGELEPSGGEGWVAVRRLLPAATTFEDWMRIDAHELRSAAPGRVRRKVTTTQEMEAILAETVTEPFPLR